MKKSKKFIPHKLKILLKSPGMKLHMKIYGKYRHKYEQLLSLEKLSWLFLVIAFLLFITKTLVLIGLIGKIVVFIAGISLMVAILLPISMLLLYCKWIINQRKIVKILNQHNLKKYAKYCLNKSAVMYRKR